MAEHALPTTWQKFKNYGTTWFLRGQTRTRRLYLFSILVGLTAGIAAVILKTLVHSIRGLLVTNNYSILKQYQIYINFPLIGILLTALFIRVFFKGKFERGVASVLKAISQKAARLERHKMFTHVITSAITVGFGGSAGLESPIVVTGSAIGSNYGQLPYFNYKERLVLLGCGAAAGIAAVFNAPIAGLLFAVEVLLTDITISAFIPLILASVTGVLCSKIILSEAILFSFRQLQPFNYYNLLFYLGLGGLSGLISLYYAFVTLKIEKLFHRFGPSRQLVKIFTGGLILGALIFIFPPLFGEGYESIKDLSSGNMAALFQHTLYEQLQDQEVFILVFIGAIALVKVVATSVTLASGGNGGNFAPSLFVGAYVGFFFSRLINLVSPYRVPEDNFTVVGMAGILSGVMYAPLTAVFLIAEITQGYDLIIPLMVVSVTSYALVRRFEQFPMDTRELARKGEIPTHNRDQNILQTLQLRELLETNYEVIPPEATLRDIVTTIASSNRNLFPVINPGNQQFMGVLMVDKLKDVLFRPELYDSLRASQLVQPPPAIIQSNEEIPRIMHHFDRTKTWTLPVVENGRFLGFISKSNIFTAYRSFLIMLSEK
ncbi:chloride channel protein [Adhaeribacter swui]|uniref:Chloride channel protein n=1 Tax=Adhaeribacter swui TaxID=2086471 RepID=A0A7G7GA17_9BACT|nr:chloride channel protein [Adhaeribacter swui]QNF34001.1 chloride channel protein [Adhaeribacter swui]